MTKTTADQWAEARAKREAGMSLSEVAQWLGVDRALVSKRAKRDQWGDGSDVAEVIARKVTEKSHGVVTPHDPEKRAAEVDAAASRVVAVIERHKADWEDHRTIIGKAIKAQDFEAAKLAKITAETLAICQTGERKAWGMDTADAKIKHVGHDGGAIKSETTHHVADAATIAAAAQILGAACADDVGENEGGPA